MAAVITDAVSQEDESQVEVVGEPEEDQDGELTMTDGLEPEEAMDKVFIPTEKWQKLEPGNTFYHCFHITLYIFVNPYSFSSSSSKE